MIQIKRIYEPYNKNDGYRVLVDRLWPRGLSKAKAYVDIWLKDIAPSHTLRKWFGHDHKKWKEFKERYKEELKDKKEMIQKIKSFEREHKTITFLYSSRDTEYNQAKALEEIIIEKGEDIF